MSVDPPARGPISLPETPFPARKGREPGLVGRGRYPGVFGLGRVGDVAIGVLLCVVFAAGVGIGAALVAP